MKIVLSLLILFQSFQSYSQIVYGSNKYIEYHIGNLPVIISVPHGGNITPSSIPDRTCNGAVNATDANTIELAKEIDRAFAKATGCNPHIIYCNLKRSKLDCNRNLADGGCGNAIAETAWNEFYNFINTAQASAQSKFSGKAFYIDLHGHGNPIQRLELGYLLYDYELANTDVMLNTSQYVGNSSIRNLVSTNISGSSHADLLRGNFALGTLLGNAGFPTVPSKQIPFPQTSENYFSGGYNTARHTSYTQTNTVNGLQIECNYINIRDSDTNRKQFADSLVSIVKKYLKIHQDIDFPNCVVTSIAKKKETNSVIVSPNPATDFIQLNFTENAKDFDVEIITLFGQTVLTARNEGSFNIQQLPKGVYLVKITVDQTNIMWHKIVLR
jgi:hypothetical protein